MKLGGVLVQYEIAQRLSGFQLLSAPVFFRLNFMDGFKEIHVGFIARAVSQA